MTETPKAKQPEQKIERVGAGGQVGEGQSGVPLHKPQGRRDAELGPRERVGAGGQVGAPRSDKE
jgi:hypothetical protein